VPYNVSKLQTIDGAAHAQCRQTLGFSDDVVHVATSGIVRGRTKRSDLVLRTLSRLRTWRSVPHLHIVGDLPRDEGRSLATLIARLGIAPYLRLRGRVKAVTLKEFLPTWQRFKTDVDRWIASSLSDTDRLDAETSIGGPGA
jgi:hypothetical protein